MRRLFALALVCGLVAPANAQAPAGPQYEWQQVFKALLSTGLILDARPDGKRIAFVRIHRFPVFVKDEPLPTFPNAVHFTTAEDVVRREVLLEPGDIFDRERLAETARNLRELHIFSVVACVPVRAEKANEVGLLVVTRDLWSLRLETRFQTTDGFIDQLRVQLTERNLFGRNKRASLRFDLLPLTFSTGAIYVDPRLAGESLRLLTSADVIFTRADAAHDGVKLLFDLARPFYDLRQPWGFDLQLEYDDVVTRQVQQGKVLGYDAPETTEVEAIPRVFSDRLLIVQGTADMQRGESVIARLSLGAGYLGRTVEAHDEARLEAVDAVAGAAFARDVLPSELHWVYPVMTFSVFAARYRTYTNLSGFGLSEDVRLGPSVSFTARQSLRALGADEDTLSVQGYATWREDWAGDGLIEAAFGGRARLRYGRPSNWIDRTGLLRARGATPTLGFGRFVARADWLLNRDHLTPPLVTLGGDNGLRAYGSQAIYGFGVDRIRTNIEYRTPPFVYSFLHLGAVAFFDAGGLLPREGAAIWRHGAGLGLRMVVPQASRFAYRLDLGVPTDGSTGFAVSLSFETGQAVPLTPAEDALYEESVGGLFNQP
ncbi:MAG: hypothetical protein KC620_10465 [Myxococcales bacterium]|nr:hypothetical protein [Myxococcales bacterium]